jgi:hypothetical protein
MVRTSRRRTATEAGSAATTWWYFSRGFVTFLTEKVDSQSRSQVAGVDGWNSGSLIVVVVDMAV